MRALASAIFLGLVAHSATAAPPGYDLYLLACDGLSDCERIANVALAPDGRQLDVPTPGFSVHVETLSLISEGANIRTELNLSPSKLYAAAQGSERSGQVALRIESTTLRQRYYSPIAVFSSSRKIYQLWGRLTGSPEASRSLALQ